MNRLAFFFSGILFFFTCFLPAGAQEEAVENTPPDSSSLIIHQLETGNQPGQVKVIQDPRLTQMLRRHFELNKVVGGPGWRILIYKGRNRAEAFNAQAEFVENFHSLKLPVDIRYEEPDFSTIVGAFRTKEEAFRFRQMLVSRFPSAYPVPARIFVD